MPQTSNEWHAIANEFERQWNFSYCLGAIDGKHIAIRNRKGYGSYFYNYKGFHSVILLAVVDANYKFLYINVGTNGRANDAAAFNESSFSNRLKNGEFHFPPDAELPGIHEKVPYVFVADDAFKLSSRVLKPHGQRSSDYHKIFNYRLSRARRVAENSFGIFANRFQIFQRNIDLPVEKVEVLTLAAAALHNFIRTRDGFESALLDSEDTAEISLTNGLSNKRRRWTREETNGFRKCYLARKEEFQHPNKKRLAYANVLEDMVSMGITDSERTPLCLEAKLRTLLNAYKAARDNNNRTGASPCFAPFMELMEEIFGKSPIISNNHTLHVGSRPAKMPAVDAVPSPQSKTPKALSPPSMKSTPPLLSLKTEASPSLSLLAPPSPEASSSSLDQFPAPSLESSPVTSSAQGPSSGRKRTAREKYYDSKLDLKKLQGENKLKLKAESVSNCFTNRG